MADKFTRRGASEGDVWYATTVGGATSVESMEDAIDAKMYTYINQDVTIGSIGTSVVQTQIGEVQIAANSLNTDFVVIATGYFADGVAGTSYNTTVKLYVGVNAAFASNTQMQSIGRAGKDEEKVGWCIAYRVQASDFTGDFTSLVYVQITGQNSFSDGTIITACESIVIIGA